MHSQLPFTQPDRLQTFRPCGADLKALITDLDVFLGGKEVDDETEYLLSVNPGSL